MPSIDVSLIGRKHDLASVRRRGHMFHLEPAGRQENLRAAGRDH